MQKIIKSIVLIVVIIALPGVSLAANKKNVKKTSTGKDDITWAKAYFNGIAGTTEKTTATGDKITLDAVVRSDLTMYELLNNVRGYSKPDSYFVGRSEVDSKGEFDIQINTTLDSDRFENASDFNKLFYKRQAEVKYPFKCDTASKTCEFDKESIVLALNDHYLGNLEGKPGEIENLAERHINVMPITSDLISIAIENRGKFRSLFSFQYNDGEGEFNAKGIEFLKKYFPLTPIVYKGRYYFPEEKGWEPKEPVVAACGNYKGTVKIIGGGPKKHNYTIIPIDTTCVKGDALISITATVGKGSAASFDVFKDNQKIPTSGSPVSIASAYDVPPGRTKVLKIKAGQSKLLRLGSEVSWKSAAGVENSVDLDISVKYVPSDSK